MVPMMVLTAVLALWIAATVLWLLDGPSPRDTAAMVLDARPASGPMTSVDLRRPVALHDAA